MSAADRDARHGMAMRAIPAGFETAHATPEVYARMYAASIADPDAFWGREGRRIDWIKPYTRVKNTNFDFGKVDIRWYEDGGAERFGQLRRPSSADARRSDGDPVGTG